MAKIVEINFEYGILKIEVIGLNNKNSADKSDAEWLGVLIDLKAPSVNLNLNADFTVSDMIELEKIFRACLNEARGEQSFCAEEESICIGVLRKNTGEIILSIRCREYGPPKIDFFIKSYTDAVSLEKALGQLVSINGNYSGES
ncbi:hypothetical protein NQT62_04045 [Limnobacter humi]|uniref:Uncharacterized protein n=1 Tax=Limnobacter humi TaxID=1778671 RepID=A0ABT1WGQ8_9BURK|nr:hypothetical protein [Limnobacter humi]MCQ8895614.1 hypothetical protein [Limnobacter humi]